MSRPNTCAIRDYDADTALATHLREYNQWWVDNVPYIDIPDANVKKMSYYRTFLNRYNYVDAQYPRQRLPVPRLDRRRPGYNNAIQLTQPMHMQDLKYFRDPLYPTATGVLGRDSRCTAFTDNPGTSAGATPTSSTSAARPATPTRSTAAPLGDPENLAHYAECDVKGQLAKYDRTTTTSSPTSRRPDRQRRRRRGAGLSTAARQDRTESAFWYAGARAAAEAYTFAWQ